MPISGNISSRTFPTSERVRLLGDVSVHYCEIESDGTTWPCGLILVKPDAASKWQPLESQASGLLGVLDEAVNTAEADAAMVVKFGPVAMNMLKVGVAAQVAPGTDILFALEERHIHPR